MEDTFKPKSLSIRQLFTDSDALYQIPMYQRPYKWVDEQILQLWDDICEAYENDQSNYFIGSVITARPEEYNNYLDIVDGQQRLTTLIILFCVYRDKFPKINSKLAETDLSAIDIATLNSSIIVNNKFSRLRLITHTHHQSDFENIILKGNTLDCKIPLKKYKAIDEEPKYKFSNTAAIFNEKLEGIGELEAGNIINFIFNKVNLIRIDCSSVNFAIKLFQVLNDRGLDLTNADLIKSYLLEKVLKRYNDDTEIKNKKVEQFLDDWKAAESNAKQSEISMNDLFISYEYYLLANNPKLSLYDELQREFKDKDPNLVIADFKSFTDHYKNLFFLEDKLIYSFWYLRWAYWKSIVLSSLHTKYPQHAELLIEIRRFYYLYWIAGYTLSKIKQISFNVIKWIKEKRSMSYISNELNLKLKADDVIAQVVNSLNNGIYNEAWCKPLYFLIEYNQTDDSQLFFLELKKRDLQLDHILPAKYYNISGWDHFTDHDKVEDWINTGGNLTLLSGRKNLDASNNKFSIKISCYKGNGKHNKKDEKVTAFKMTQKIADDFDAGKFNSEWNWKAINSRWKWFCKEVEEILDIDLTEIRNQT